jgi:hypothetical protein
LIQPTHAIGPETVINGFGTCGRNYLYPFDENEKYIDAQQTFERNSRTHALKFGVNVSPVRDSSGVQTFFGGRFLFGNHIPRPGLLGAPSPGPATLLARYLTGNAAAGITSGGACSCSPRAECRTARRLHRRLRQPRLPGVARHPGLLRRG